MSLSQDVLKAATGCCEPYFRPKAYTLLSEEPMQTSPFATAGEEPTKSPVV